MESPVSPDPLSLTEPSPEPLPPSASNTAPSATSSKTRSPKKSSVRGSAMDLSRTRQSGMMCALSPQSGLEAMLQRLQADSPASRFRSLASELAKRTNAIYSEKLSESLLQLDASSSSWKTSQVCLFPMSDSPTSQHQLQTFLDSWPKAALIVHGCLWPQKIWERRTAENAGGVSLGENWSTPTATDTIETDGRLRPSRTETGRTTDYLAREVMWHTPHGQMNVDHTGKIGGGGELDMQVKAWRTPCVSDAGSPGASIQNNPRGHDNVSAQVKQWQTPSAENFRTRGGDRADEMGLDNQVKNWSTPQEHDHHPGSAERVGRFGTDAGGRNLTDEVMLKNWSTPTDDDANNATRASGLMKSLTRDVQAWATPRAEDAECAGSRIARGVNDTLYSQTRAWGTPIEEQADTGKAKESLNPDWEEILMGWEIGWTDPENVCAGEFPGWPMGQGSEQYPYEPLRTLPREQMKHRTGRIKCIGNGIVPQAATAAYIKLLSLLLQ